MLPTPRLTRRGTIEVLFGGTDAQNVGRVFCLEVDAAHPERIVSPPGRPFLEPGAPGAFDERGVVPSALVDTPSGSFLFYSGFGARPGVPYTIFTGLARLDESSGSYRRVGSGQLLGAQSQDTDFLGGCHVLQVGTAYRMWVLRSAGWTKDAQGKELPVYAIFSTDSASIEAWSRPLEACINRNDGLHEIGFTRPWVVARAGEYHMWFAVRRLVGNTATYDSMGFAASADGRSFVREDQRITFKRSGESWDREMICYPTVLRVGDRTLMFYCGNGNGRGGIGWAELER